MKQSTVKGNLDAHFTIFMQFQLSKNKQKLKFYNKMNTSFYSQHEGLQAQLDCEIKIRDGAFRLVTACTHELQLLEVAKTLHASNTRTLSYMTRLQQLKASEMMEAIMDDSG